MILKFEIKKILKRRTSKIALFFLVCFIMGSVFFSVHGEVWTDVESGEVISGIAAVKAAREAKSQWNGVLSENVIEKVIAKNREYVNSSDYQSEDLETENMQGYEEIKDLINRSYGGFFSYDYYTCDSIKPGEGNLFYENRVSQIKKWLESDKLEGMAQEKKEYFLNQAEGLPVPFTYSYMDGWKTIMDSMSIVLFLVALVICILLAPVFAGEYESGSSSIVLSSKHGRDKVVFAKIIGSFIVATAVYFMTFMVFSLAVLGIYGYDGYQCQIQANGSFWKSFYHETHFTAYMLLIMLGFVGCLLLATITIFVSSLMKTSLSAIIIPFVIIMVPKMINTSTFPVLEKIMGLMPHETLLGSIKLSYYTVYSIFGRILTPFQLIPLLYVIVIALLVPVTVRAFQRYQE